MDILKSGDRFMAKTKLGDEYEYEFVGLDLNDEDGNTYDRAPFPSMVVIYNGNKSEKVGVL